MLLIIPYVHSLVLQIEKLGDTYYLLKRNVVLADAGKYICVASNEIGKAHCSAFVTVIGNLSCQMHVFWKPLALLYEQPVSTNVHILFQRKINAPKLPV